MSELSEREQLIRKGLRKEKRDHWRYIDGLFHQYQGVTRWLEFWEAHWPPDKSDLEYVYGADTHHLRRHVRIQRHYLRQSEERRFQLEQMFAGDGRK